MKNSSIGYPLLMYRRLAMMMPDAVASHRKVIESKDWRNRVTSTFSSTLALAGQPLAAKVTLFVIIVLALVACGREASPEARATAERKALGDEQAYTRKVQLLLANVNARISDRTAAAESQSPDRITQVEAAAAGVASLAADARSMAPPYDWKEVHALLIEWFTIRSEAESAYAEGLRLSSESNLAASNDKLADALDRLNRSDDKFEEMSALMASQGKSFE